MISDEAFEPCRLDNPESGVIQWLWRDRSYVAKPVVPGVHHFLDDLVAMDDGRVIGVQFWGATDANLTADAPEIAAAERLRAYKTPPDINALARDLNKAGETEYGKPPEIAAAEIRGLEMAKEIIHRDGPGVRVPLNAHALDTRIAELKAKTEPGK